MSSYHSSFTYNEKNSLKDKGLIIAAFEPDDGLMDTFLSMDPIYEDYYDGTQRFDYGSRYNTSATIKITVIKNNSMGFSVSEVRSCLKWLTGVRSNSWLDMYVGDEIVYSFLAKCTNVQQQKMDARTIGLVLTFTSVSPWAYSAPQSFDCSLWQLIDIDSDGTLFKSGDALNAFGHDNGTVHVNSEDKNSYFNYYEDEGIVHLDNAYRTVIDNQTDDLYTYIYLDIDYKNESGTRFSVINQTLNEKSVVDGMTANELVVISAKQFIVSYGLTETGERAQRLEKIFGDNFNFIWPRLCPGENKFMIESNGRGVAGFTYRYPIKIGDCAMDVFAYGSEINCCCDGDHDGGNDNVNSYDGPVEWDNIINTPNTIAGYGITDAYTINEVDSMTSGKVNEQELNDMLSSILG